MVVTYPNPHARYTVTHSATDYYIESMTEIGTVTLRENAVDTARLTISDEYADHYTNYVASGDRLRIYFGTDDPPTNLVFDGYVDDSQPTLTADGIKLAVTARSVGRSLLMSVCGEEYGSESNHDDLDTMKEIITDATDGIVPNWVNKIPWSTDTTSGYSLGLDSGGTDYVATIAGAINYLYFAYQPANKCLDDLMDVVQAIKGTNAGPHYIVVPTNYLCVATVGSHEAGPANLWPTWWNTDQAGSTLVQGVDFKTHSFHNYAAEANYILYHGRFRKPVNEAWTEEGDASANGADLWTDSSIAWTVSDETGAGLHPIGSSSIKVHIDDEPLSNYAQVPDSNQSWEIDKWGGMYNKPILHLQAYKSSANPPLSITVYLMTDNNTESWSYRIDDKMSADTWVTFDLPVGPYFGEEVDEKFAGWTDSGAATWTDVEDIRFYSASNAGDLADFYIDDLHFNGWILRGVRQNAAYSTTNPVKVKTVTDDVAKDDSGIASDDSGMIARLAYAEYLRAKTTPIQGQITIPGQWSIQAGQLCHIHAAKDAGGTFNINDDFRIQQHQLNFTKDGFFSTLTLTDDVVNARPRPPHDAYNILLKATNPDYQNRQVSSIKARDIDITQTVMEKSY